MIYYYNSDILLYTLYYDVTMNKKLLICSSIALTLALSACSKTETPEENQQNQVEEINTPAASEPELNMTEASEVVIVEAQEIVEPQTRNIAPTTENKPTPQPVQQHNTSNTNTERTTSETTTPPKAETQNTPPATPATTPSNNTPAKSTAPQSQDDAVAAAIAAATPALD